MKYVIIVLILASNLAISIAQDTLELSREYIIGKVLNQNFDLLLSEYEVIKSRGSLSFENTLTLPDIFLSYFGMTTDNPMMAFGFRLNQERVEASDFSPDALNDPARIDNFSSSDIEGFKSWDTLAIASFWFPGEKSSLRPVMLFSFTQKENIDRLFPLVEEFNQHLESSNPVRAAVVLIERRI